MKVRRDGKAKGVRVRKANVLKDKKSGKITKTQHSKETIRKLASLARNRSLRNKRKSG